MSTLKSALRNLQLEASSLAPREFTLADGSSVRFDNALSAIADSVESANEFSNRSGEIPFIAQSVYQAATVFWNIQENHVFELQEKNSRAFEIALRSLSYLNKDLPALATTELSRETLNRGIETAHDVYEGDEATPENRRRFDDWLHILKSPENFQSAIQGVAKELERSRLTQHAQDAHNKLSPPSARQP